MMDIVLWNFDISMFEYFILFYQKYYDCPYMYGFYVWKSYLK